MVDKKAGAKTYTSWQWRIHHQYDLGHKKVDLELGDTLWGMRTRLYVALGELKAKTLVERFCRWRFRRCTELKAYTGDRGHGDAAWWVSFPQLGCDMVKLRFRSGSSNLDFRRRAWRGWVQTTEADATFVWNQLNRDPIVELARLQWQEQQANDVVTEYMDDKLPALRKAKRNGDISKRDFEADERRWMVNVEGFEGIASASASAWDEHLAEMVAALPRPRRQELKPRIIAMADRHFNDAATQNRWHADQWSDHLFSWRVS